MPTETSIKKNASRGRKNEETMQTASMRGALWGGDEEAYLKEHLEEPTFDTAIELGRTLEGVQWRRQVLKLKRKSGPNGGPPRIELLTMEEARLRRKELKEQGMPFVTIMTTQYPGKFYVIEGRATDGY